MRLPPLLLLLLLQCNAELLIWWFRWLSLSLISSFFSPGWILSPTSFLVPRPDLGFLSQLKFPPFFGMAHAFASCSQTSYLFPVHGAVNHTLNLMAFMLVGFFPGCFFLSTSWQGAQGAPIYESSNWSWFCNTSPGTSSCLLYMMKMMDWCS